MDSHHFSHKLLHRTSKVSTPCNWLLPAPFHAQHKLPNTCLQTWRHSGKSQLGPLHRHSDLPILCIFLQGTGVMPWHTHWPRLAQQWNKAWVGSSEGYRPHSCQGIPRLPLPGTFSKCSTHTETVHRDWMRGGGRWGKVKNGRQQWGRTGRGEVGLDSEIRSGSTIQLCWGMK